MKLNNVTASAIVPRNELDPTGTARSVAGASNSFEKRLNAVFNYIYTIIKEIEYTTVNVNQSFAVINQLNVQRRYKFSHETCEPVLLLVKRKLHVNEVVYNYDLSPLELSRIGATIEDIVNRALMIDKNGNLVRVDNARQLWFMDGYVEPQYLRGTSQAYSNLALQSEVYASAVSSVSTLLMSPQYQTRIGFVAAREFELMQGFTADVVSEARRVLGEGVALGKSPREISTELKSRINVSKSRARRIAATEIPNALRKANVAEGRQAEINFGIKTKYLWMSAFKKTSRQSHISRSGHYHTAKEDEEFYSQDGNRISCYCTQIMTVVNDDGKPLNNLAQEKVLSIKSEFLKSE